MTSGAALSLLERLLAFGFSFLMCLCQILALAIGHGPLVMTFSSLCLHWRTAYIRGFRFDFLAIIFDTPIRTLAAAFWRWFLRDSIYQRHTSEPNICHALKYFVSGLISSNVYYMLGSPAWFRHKLPWHASTLQMFIYYHMHHLIFIASSWLTVLHDSA